MKKNQYLALLLTSILILTSYGTVNATSWKDDLRGVNSSGSSLSDDIYFGLGYSVTKFSVDGAGSLDTNPTALVGRFGGFATENFAIEGRYGLGVAHDSITISGGRLNEKIDSIFGVYGILHANLSADSSVYGLLGFTKAELTSTESTSTSSSATTRDWTGVSIGVGLDIGKFNIELTQYIRESQQNLNDIGLDLTAITLGYTF
jgi:hypothetical protein